MCMLTRYLGLWVLFFNCLVGCLSMVVWTPVLGVLHACVLYFCTCTCSAQLSMFYMEKRSRIRSLLLLSVFFFLLLLLLNDISI